MDHACTTTAFTLDGYRIVRTLGVVRGITVRSRNIFGTIGGSLQTLFGGNITPLHRAVRAGPGGGVRDDGAATPRIEGANAIIGVRYDATELMQGVTEVLCYGTAVVDRGGRRAGTDA